MTLSNLRLFQSMNNASSLNGFNLFNSYGNNAGLNNIYSGFGWNRNLVKYAIKLQYGIQDKSKVQGVTQPGSATRSAGNVRMTETAAPGKVRTTEIQKDVSSGTTWDSYLEDVRAQARKDAANGVYMGDAYQSLESNYREKYISPDREKATAEADTVIRQAPERYGIAYYKAQGSSNTVSVWKAGGTSSEIYDKNGEMIAYRQGTSGQWTSVQTTGETYVAKESSRVYAEAYKAAQLEIKSAEQAKLRGGPAALDVRV